MDLRDQFQATLTGTYTLHRELGGGGMSRAFLAVHGAGGARLLGACVLTLLASQPVAGQDSALVVPGARERYWLPESSKPVEADVVSRTTDRIRVRPVETGDTLEFAPSALSRLEVRRGPEPQGEAGAALGLFGGAIIGSRVHRYRWQAVPLVPDAGSRGVNRAAPIAHLQTAPAIP